MPLDENDPEVRDTKDHIKLLYKRQDIVEIKRRAHRQKFEDMQKLLLRDEAEYNQIVGAISATEELMSKFKENAK